MKPPVGWPHFIALGVCTEALAACTVTTELAGDVDAQWSESRRTDFARGRIAAGRAVTSLGLHAVPLPRTEHGPCWPAGTVGSITHTTGIAVAAAALNSSALALGIDIERSDRKLRPDLTRRIATPTETKWVAAASSPDERRQRLLALFIAKEAVWKALSPLGAPPLSFTDVTIDFSTTPCSATFREGNITFRPPAPMQLSIFSWGEFLLSLVLLRQDG